MCMKGHVIFKQETAQFSATNLEAFDFLKYHWMFQHYDLP